MNRPYLKSTNWNKYMYIQNRNCLMCSGPAQIMSGGQATRRNFGRFRTFIIPRPYYDSSHWNYFRKSSMKEVLK
jgi:hypothetical protein